MLKIYQLSWNLMCLSRALTNMPIFLSVGLLSHLLCLDLSDSSCLTENASDNQLSRVFLQHTFCCKADKSNRQGSGYSLVSLWWSLEHDSTAKWLCYMNGRLLLLFQNINLILNKELNILIRNTFLHHHISYKLIIQFLVHIVC